ncbi:MAG: ABC transporter ATP-binding protein [Egibacteraceae bacterium]
MSAPTLSPHSAVPASPPAALGVENLRVSFGSTPVLRGAGLTVEPGRTLALLGPSGCGKTTLLRSVAGLERIDAGRVSLADRVLSDGREHVRPEHRRIGMVFQDWALFPHLSVGRNVAFGLRRDERRSRRVAEVLELVDLAGFADRMPETLSGGQQQRVALARALANRPALILLDEPFSNLDSALREQIRVEVQQLLHDLSITTVFVTHSQEEAFVVGDEVAVMLDGQVVQQARPAELYRAPASRAVAEFVGDANLVPAVAHGLVARTTVGEVPLRQHAEGLVEVLLRPEQLVVSAGGDAVVDAVEYYGHDAIYLIRSADGALLRSRVIDAPTFQRGDQVRLAYVGGPAVVYARS